MSDKVQSFLIRINPEPWRVPPMSAVRSKHNGKLVVASNRDEQLASYQEAVREEIALQGGYLMSPPYKIEFWFWRNLARHKKEVDATNMQKACEDALQGLIINNDRNVRSIHTESVEQGATTPGMILIVVTGEFTDESNIPVHHLSQVERMYNSDKTALEKQTYSDMKIDNSWP